MLTRLTNGALYCFYFVCIHLPTLIVLATLTMHYTYHAAYTYHAHYTNKGCGVSDERLSISPLYLPYISPVSPLYPPGCGVSDERLAARTLLGHLASPLVRYAASPPAAPPPLYHPCMHVAAFNQQACSYT